MSSKIRFNGVEYNSPEEMAPDVRASYEQALSLAQEARSSAFPGRRINVSVSTKVRYVHDGKVYNDLSELPPEAREKYEKAMASAGKDHGGLPDFLEDPGLTASSAGSSDQLSPPESTIAPLSPQPPVISAESAGSGLLLASVVVILLLLLVIAGLLLYIGQH
jgi:hypothetical protein